MSTIPYLLKGVRFEGFHMGPKTLLDGWSDSVDPTCGCGMGETAENLVDKYKLSREEQDRFAMESHQKAAKAQAEGWFDDEVVPVDVAQKKGAPLKLGKDESIRAETTMEGLAKLKPAFRKEGGSVTAGNACGMTDGACALVLTTREQRRRRWASRRCFPSWATRRRRWSRSSWARVRASRSRWRSRRRAWRCPTWTCSR